MRRIVGGFALLCALLGVGCREPQADEGPVAPRIASVRTIAVEPTTWKEPVGTFGVLEAAAETTLSVSFPARVQEVLFEEGRRVEIGQTLVRFERDKSSLRVQQSHANVDSAKAGLDDARSNLDRLRGLERRDAVTPQELEMAENTQRVAAARYRDALAARGLARRELSEGELVSPVAGVVESRTVEPGETVMPGRPLAIVQSIESLRVLTHVSEKDINQLRIGASAQIFPSATRGRTYEGRITSLGVTADPRTGNFPVKLSIEANDGLLRPGMTARIELEGLGIPDTIVIDETTIVDRKRRRVIYVAVDGKASEVEPVLGLTSGQTVQVLDGLEAGDRLITSSLELVADGTPIEVVDAPEP